MWGLWRVSQGCPRIKGNSGELIKWKAIFSRWWDTETVRGSVILVTDPGAMGLPSKAMISRGEDRGLTGTWRREAMAMSIKFPAAPESTKACNWCSLPPLSRVTGRNKPVFLGETNWVTPETALPLLLGTGSFPSTQDIVSDNGPEVHSRGKDGNSSGEYVLGQTTGFCLVAWALETQEVQNPR